MVGHFGKYSYLLSLKKFHFKIEVCEVYSWIQTAISLAWHKDWKQLTWLSPKFKNTNTK